MPGSFRLRSPAGCGRPGTDFGSKKGKYYLYHSLQEKTANKLIFIGCSAHNVHKTVQSVSGCLTIDTCPLTGKKLPALSHLCHTY